MTTYSKIKELLDTSFEATKEILRMTGEMCHFDKDRKKELETIIKDPKNIQEIFMPIFFKLLDTELSREYWEFCHLTLEPERPSLEESGLAQEG